MPVKKEICVPDIGGATQVEVIEVQIAVGDTIAIEDSLITLEGDKATMEIPSPYAGVVKALHIAVGDKASEGTPILSVEVSEEETSEVPQITDAPAQPASMSQPSSASKPEEQTHVEKVLESTVSKSVSDQSQTQSSLTEMVDTQATVNNPQVLSQSNIGSVAAVHAGPAVRRMARELGVDLTQVVGTGEKGRIIKSDVDHYVKRQLSTKNVRTQFGLSAPSPIIDFSQFGPVEYQALNRIKKMSGATLHRNWVSVPHVTQFGEADITGLEAFRKQHKSKALEQGFKLTIIAFVMKAVVAALKAFPLFNASLDETGERLVLKHYFHIGVAVDTPNGLVVPVVRYVDQQGIFELAKVVTELGDKARSSGLSIADMQGSCFTISSLGGIGGTAFTPIVNSPDVAILGISTSQMKPVYEDGQFVPRLMLPLSLSYDHRVIDGALGARFMVYLTKCLSDMRLLLL